MSSGNYRTYWWSTTKYCLANHTYYELPPTPVNEDQNTSGSTPWCCHKNQPYNSTRRCWDSTNKRHHTWGSRSGTGAESITHPLILPTRCPPCSSSFSNIAPYLHPPKQLQQTATTTSFISYAIINMSYWPNYFPGKYSGSRNLQKKNQSSPMHTKPCHSLTRSELEERI